ncbi:MAG TPA: hypothetical protein PK239_07235 [Chitinophagales bacterium]|nr:hypothetical protein [Chitinophagales bacterium]
MLKTLWRLVVKLGYTHFILFAFILWSIGCCQEYLIRKYGDIVYATIKEDPYISRKDCKTLLQYEEYKSVHRLGHWTLCDEGKFKKGNTYPVRYYQKIPRFVEVSTYGYWFALPFFLLCLYFIYFTIKEHIKFFREEREKKQNTA